MSRLQQLNDEIASICNNTDPFNKHGRKHILYFIHAVLLFAQYKLHIEANVGCVFKLILQNEEITTEQFCGCLGIVKSVFNVTSYAQDIHNALTTHYHISNEQMESLELLEDSFSIFNKLVEWYDAHTFTHKGPYKTFTTVEQPHEQKTKKLTRKQQYDLRKKQEREQVEEAERAQEAVRIQEAKRIQEPWEIERAKSERNEVLLFGALLFLGIWNAYSDVPAFLKPETHAKNTSVILPTPIPIAILPTPVTIHTTDIYSDSDVYINPVELYAMHCTPMLSNANQECVHVQNTFSPIDTTKLKDTKLTTLPRILWEHTNQQIESIRHNGEDGYNAQLTQLAKSIMPLDYLVCMDIHKWTLGIYDVVNEPITQSLSFSAQTRLLLQSQPPSFRLSQYYKMNVANDFLARMQHHYQISHPRELQNIWIVSTKQWFHNHTLFFPELESLLCEIYHQPTTHCQDRTCPFKLAVLPKKQHTKIVSQAHYKRSRNTPFMFPLSTLPSFLQKPFADKHTHIAGVDKPARDLIEELAKKIFSYVPKNVDLDFNDIERQFIKENIKMNGNELRELWMQTYPQTPLFYLKLVGYELSQLLRDLTKENQLSLWRTNVVQWFHGHSLLYPPLEPILSELFQGFHQVCPDGWFCHVQNFFFEAKTLEEMVAKHSLQHEEYQQHETKRRFLEQKQKDLDKIIKEYDMIGLKFPSLEYVIHNLGTHHKHKESELTEREFLFQDNDKYTLSKRYQGWELLLPYMSWMAIGNLQGWREFEYGDYIDSFQDPIQRLAITILEIPAQHFLRILKNENGELRMKTTQGIMDMIENMKRGEPGPKNKWFLTEMLDVIPNVYVAHIDSLEAIRFPWRNTNLKMDEASMFKSKETRDYTGHEQWYHMLFQLNLYYDCYQWGYSYEEVRTLWLQASHEWLQELPITEPRLVPFLWEIYRGGKQQYDVMKLSYAPSTKTRMLKSEWKPEYYLR